MEREPDLNRARTGLESFAKRTPLKQRNDTQVPVEDCDVPSGSIMDRRMIDAAYFRDAYRAPSSRAADSIVDVFFAVFGHHPMWIRRVLIARNRLAGWCGLQTPTAAQILHPQRKASYRVGDTIGPWPLFELTPSELVAGRDNLHLDFRLSVLRQQHDGTPSVVVSTVCTPHNVFGRIYLRLVIPFHKWGVRHLMHRAIAAGRL